MSIADVIEEYVLARAPDAIVSTRHAIELIRLTCSACEHTDAELGELAAIVAVRYGRMVAFEARETDVPSILHLL